MRLINLSTEKYPYTIAEIKRDHPNVSLPKNPTIADLYFANVAEVVVAERPYCNEKTQILVQEEPKLIKGVWTITWKKVKREAPAPIPEWENFYLYWASNPDKIKYDLYLMGVNPTLPTKLDLAYKSIQVDGLIEFQRIFQLYCITAKVSFDHKSDWVKKANELHLPKTFAVILGKQ